MYYKGCRLNRRIILTYYHLNSVFQLHRRNSNSGKNKLKLPAEGIDNQYLYSSVVMVVEFHTGANEIQYSFTVQWSILKGLFDNFKDLVMKSCQKLGIFYFQSQFQKPKLTSIFQKMVSLSKFT